MVVHKTQCTYASLQTNLISLKVMRANKSFTWSSFVLKIKLANDYVCVS